MQKPAFVFDGRNILDADQMKAIGFVYLGIGA
jgi:UDPglucose 6-dehydrogenase